MTSSAGPTDSDIPAARRISRPAELTSLLAELEQAVRLGHLQQVRPDSSPASMDVALQDLPTSPPWPDYIEMHFVCPRSRARFKLAVETYHGAGGRWERV